MDMDQPIQLAELNQNLAVYEKRQSQSGRHGVALDNINRRLKWTLEKNMEYLLKVVWVKEHA